MKAQLATDATQVDLARCIESQGWALEQKLDGHRILAYRGRVLNRNGDPYGHAVPTELREALPRYATLDGELVEGRYWAFDLLELDGTDLRSQPLRTRRNMLTELRLDPIQTTTSLWSPQIKILAAKDLLEQRAEGVILKDLSAPYREGRSKSWLKYKFVRTIDCVVMELNRNGKQSAVVGIRKGSAIVEVGKVSLIGRPVLQVGDIIEVMYLYASDDDRLVQPRMRHLRDDKDQPDTVFELVHTNKQVAALSDVPWPHV